MQRFHAHVAVDDLQQSIAFYSKLFAQQPTIQREDYAKWMLDDPRLNFAISSRGHTSGLNHFGFQVESELELQQLRLQAGEAAGSAVLEQPQATCCYARSEKHWTMDPQGIAWEHFLTLEDVPVYGKDTVTPEGACCVPLKTTPERDEAGAGCCVPSDSSKEACCG